MHKLFLKLSISYQSYLYLGDLGDQKKYVIFLQEIILSFCTLSCAIFKWFCRVMRKGIAVPVPDMIRQYNAYMGGIDLLDNMVAVYQIPYRIKK